jgi:hypothetical protein
MRLDEGLFMQQAQGSRSVTDDASSVGSMRSVIDVQPRAYELIDVDVWLLQKDPEIGYHSSSFGHKTGGSTAVQWLG